MTEYIALKLEKEAFVSGLVGGSVSEINRVTAVALSGYALWAALQTRTRATDVRTYSLPAFVLDAALNSLCLLFAITTYASHSLLLNILLLTPTLYLYLQPPLTHTPHEKNLAALEKEKHPGKPKKPEIVSSYKPFVTAYRGGMMVITCLAILAVDFEVFPRRFAKAETWGTSLMDLGVGSFVFSSGLVSSRHPETSLLQQIWTAVRSSGMILILGIVRTVLTKTLDYQEHVTEYGVHWNFFITLGLLPPFVTLLRLIRWKRLPYSVFACLIIVGYQWALDRLPFGEYDTLTKYIALSGRNDLFSQNREGIFSFLGYLSVFLVGLDVGNLIFSPNPLSFPSIRSPRISMFIWLIVCSIISIAAFQLTTEYFKVTVSRRFVASFMNLLMKANLPYVLWMVAHNSTFLLGYLVVQTIFFPAPNPPCDEAVPWTLEAFNRNGLAMFLLANIMTGLVNLSINTLKVTTVQAMGVLSIYILALNGVAGALRYKGWKLKI